MSEQRVALNRLSTGVPGLDRVLGGGLPEYSFNLIAGAPGIGKTTLSQQIMYANATAERPVLHFTVLGEPPLKMLRYQQQFGFFDAEKLESVIHYRNLSDEVLSGDLSRVLDAIVGEVERLDPRIVVVDSFRTMVQTSVGNAPPGTELQRFLQQLSLHLTNWEVTSFLIGEYMDSEVQNNPLFTIADGILWLYELVERNSSVRKIRAMKVRGHAPMPGLHTFRITDDGLRVFPRTDQRFDVPSGKRPEGRLSVGIEGMDAMLGGGIPAGDSVLVAGPSGSGKTALSTHFVAEGARQGQKAVIAVFEENPDSYLARAASLGLDLPGMVERDELRVIYLRPLDLSADEALHEIQEAVQELGAVRVVIDSLSGFEIALAQTFQDDFRESLYRMVSALTRAGITVMMTVEVTDDYTTLRFSPHAISFLTDDLILQRYVELEGRLRRVMAVVKMRSSSHRADWCSYEITPEGLVVGEPMRDYRGIVSGIPVPVEQDGAYAGLVRGEVEVMRALERLGPAGRAEIAAEAEMGHEEVRAALERLLKLNYALVTGEGEGAFYRAAARSLMR
jgi:circadian clock protein KaiC